METYVLEGNISVKAALQSKHRKVFELLVDPKKKDKDTSFIVRLAKKQGIPVISLAREELDAIASGKTHGGLLARCGERNYQRIEDVISSNCFLALVEGVEDPFNFGYVLRSLYAAGCDGIIVPPRNWTTAAGVVAKASAGASEFMNIIVADDMEALLQKLKQANVALVCANRKDAICLYDYTFPKSVCIAIGGEMRGLSKLVETNSDQNVYIPYLQDFKNALTANSSTAIMAFELVRQRQYKKKTV